MSIRITELNNGIYHYEQYNIRKPKIKTTKHMRFELSDMGDKDLRTLYKTLKKRYSSWKKSVVGKRIESEAIHNLGSIADIPKLKDVSNKRNLINLISYMEDALVYNRPSTLESQLVKHLNVTAQSANLSSYESLMYLQKIDINDLYSTLFSLTDKDNYEYMYNQVITESYLVLSGHKTIDEAMEILKDAINKYNKNKYTDSASRLYTTRYRK